MVDCARLESGYTLTGIEGSNPSLSALKIETPFWVFLCLRKKRREASHLRGSREEFEWLSPQLRESSFNELLFIYKSKY